MSLLNDLKDLKENKVDENVFACGKSVAIDLKAKKSTSKPLTDSMTEDDFLKWNISELQKYLSDRLVNQTGNKAILAKNAYYAYCLNLQVQVQSAQEDENEFKNDKLKKRKILSQLIVDPILLTYGWVIGPSLFPDVTYAEVQFYLNKKNAGKAFRGGKSLFESDHLSNIRYHNISSDSEYCYIAAYCLPEQKINNPIYNVWVLINKKHSTIKCADCDCAAGISGCCKHVGALLWYVEYSVKIGANKTCTSKPLEWLKPSKKVQKLYGPSILSEIEIKKPFLKDKLVYRKKKVSNRLHFDPRATNQREVTMSQEDVDSLAQITNYNCGYVMLMQTKNVVPVPDISNIAQEIEVHTSLQPFLPKTPYEIVTYFDCKISYKFLLRQLATNFDEISQLEHLTRKQSCNNDWHKHRKGRVTASKVYNVVHRVNNELEILCPEKLTYIITGVLSKSKFFQTKATSWGLRHEKDVLEAYWKENKKKHRFMKVTECGLFVNKDLPIVGASPDSLVHCDCCGTGCVEVKCPWTHRGLTIPEFANIKGTCLIFENNTIVLDRQHSYYSQVQCQMASTGFSYCDFVVGTSKDLFSYRVPFSSDFWKSCVQKIEYFYKTMILPYMINEVISQTVESVLNETLLKICINDIIDDDIDFFIS